MTKLANHINVSFYLILVIVTLMFSRVVDAQSWQLMLLPNSDSALTHNTSSATPNKGAAAQPVSDESIAYAVDQFESGVSMSLSQGKDALVSYQKAFTQCLQKWCAQSSLENALEQIRNTAGQIQLVILYDISQISSGDIVANVKLMDPLSYSILVADKVTVATNLASIDYFSVGQQVGQLIDTRLKDIIPSTSYQLMLSGFLVNELSGLSTYILSNSPDSLLKLINAKQYDSLFGMYKPLVSSEYELQSSLSATQFNQLLQQYFTRQNINIQTQYVHTTKALIVKRTGNPHAPSLITLLFLFLLFIAACSVLVRRQFLDFYLSTYTTQKNAKAWLATYKKARFPLYRLKRKWESHSLYWQRLERESDEFAQQAKIYYDAGDVNTAKLFISKSLHTNSVNAAATALSKQIEYNETTTQHLSENEQWIRNKVAKAMNNYRQQEPIKALRRAYQAHERATQIKGLKRQAKAINKLINKIRAEFVTSVSAMTLNCSRDPSSYLICQNQTVHIGRLPNKTDTPWISKQDSVFYVNHMSVSRIGQQCNIQRVEQGYCLQDMGSKNGSIVNQQLCEPNELRLLTNGDVIQIGAKSPSTAVRLAVSISPDNELLQLCFAQDTNALLDKRAVNKVWADNTLATRTALICVKRSYYLLCDQSTGKMQLRYFSTNDKQAMRDDDKKLKSTLGSFVVVCKISLGSNASISPFDSALTLSVDDVPLLGPVPLQLPVNLQWINNDGLITNFQLTNYDSTAIRYAYSPLLEANI